MKCKITRSPQGQIDFVQAPNGEQSKLYSDALDYTGNQEQALNIWSLSYTDRFLEINGPLQKDENGEFNIEIVLSYIKAIKNEGSSLQNQDINDLRNNLLDLPITSISELYTVLNSTFYEDGQFVINKGKLQASNIYTPLEVQTILTDSDIQKRIKTITDRIIGEVVFKDDSTSELNSLLDTTFFSEDLLITDTSEIIGIGKFKKLNPNEVENILLKSLAGKYTERSFDNALSEIPFESIQEHYKNNKEFASQLFDRFSRFKMVQTLDSETLQPKITNDVLDQLKQTAVVEPTPNGIVSDINFLSDIPSEIWEESRDEIETTLKAIETKAIEYGVDVIGLSNLFEEVGQSEFEKYFDSLRSLLLELDNASADESSLSNFAQAHIDFFGIEQENELVPIELNSVSERDSNFVVLEGVHDELDLFVNNSLVKVRDNIYHRVTKVNDPTTAYEMLYELAIFNSRVLPEQAYYPSAFDSDNRLNLTKLKDRENADDIINDIKRFVRTQATTLVQKSESFNPQSAESLLIHKLAFEHPITETVPEVNLKQELSRHSDYKGDYDYLTTTFIADFYGLLLQEKQDNSQLYNNVLKYFTVSSSGIKLKNTDPYTIQGIRLFLPKSPVFTALKNYSRISKDPSIQSLFPVNDHQEIITDKFLRDYYANNRGVLPMFNNAYELSETGNLLTTLNVQENFIEVPEGVYERINEHRNISFYRRLPRLGNEFFKQYKSGISVSSNIDTSQVADMVENLSKAVDIRNLASKSELVSINEQIDECNG